MKRTQILFAFLLTFLGGLVLHNAAAKDPPRIAVLELRGTLPTSSLMVLSDKVRAGVLDTTKGREFLVMSRENIAMLVKDMGLDLTCIEGACEVETGRNIGATYVVSGGVTQLGGAWICALKIHQTETGALLASGDTQAASPLALRNLIPALVVQLMTKALGGPLPESKIDEKAKRWEGKWTFTHDGKYPVELTIQLKSRGIHDGYATFGGTYTRIEYDPGGVTYQPGSRRTMACSGRPTNISGGHELILREDLDGKPMGGSHCTTLRITNSSCFMDGEKTTCPD